MTTASGGHPARPVAGPGDPMTRSQDPAHRSPTRGRGVPGCSPSSRPSDGERRVTAEAGVGLRYGAAAGRWVLLATVLGSGMAFLDGTVVTIALPAIGRDLGAGAAGLQWVVNAYTLTLAAFILLGGSLGDRFGRRRVFLIGVVAFTAASVLCGV